ncbi:endo-1,4-beta-xylanase [Thermoanaerobacterium sp. CMT5567-10]|uniref:endo-1,4-beta-xylanase n=1 Tax=Thermoanaerobacterium sp. CMT5567-10 TaxID=3061989 RepID=UPI0026DF04A9|nr:endo-1,4-beta-xylanase [Thermoanaerobacterium sp. CMT5567-10]WKV08626.1 endo-1,4-beta-xylanase [Thermoanaerobacterium sp. CMT5567-10]
MSLKINKIVSFITVFIMILGTSMYMPHVKVFADSTSTNLVSNGTFENGNTSGWAGTGSSVVKAVYGDAHSGDYSLLTTGRTANWNGPSYDLTGKIVPGQQYNVDFWVKFIDGNDTEQIKATVKATSDKDNYIQVNDFADVSKGEWTEIKGSFTLPIADYSAISIYVESPNPTVDFYIDDFSVIGEISNNQITIQNDIPDLYSVFKDYFPIGVAVDPSRLNDTDPHAQLTAKHFNMFVAENAMKPESLQPTEGNFTFDNADKIVDYVIAHNMKMRGHTLLWHNQVPDWFFQDPSDPSKPASRDLLLERLKTHITTVLDHFKTKYGSQNPIIGWDVVNEVLDDNGNLRNSKWLQIIGPDYIEKAFEYAHEADPSMKLFINDYNIENNGVKTQAMYDLVKKLKSEGVPIDGIGMQMHININSNIDNIKASIEKLASLGVEIQVTELDMNMNGDVSNEALLKQARLYKQLFDLFKAEKQYITAVVFWGVSDDVSWLSKPNAPLLFDSKLQAKPAYWAIVDTSKAIPDIQSAKALEGSPTIGANIDSFWKLVKPLYANTYVKGIVGATATVKFMWDTKNLYLLVQVSDNTPSNNDGIEIFVDKNDNKSTSYETDDEHYTIKRDGTGSSNITKYVTSNNYGYVVQLAIPIEDINPALNDKIGFDIRINDDEGSGNIDAITVWNDYTNSQDTNTSYFGDIVLSKSAQIATAIYGTPVIDGKVDDIWNNVEAISTNTWVLGSNGATATAKTMWDDKYLYVLADVTDSNLNKSSVNPYEQDSVEVFVDQNNDKTTYYENDDGQYRVNYDNEQSFGGSTNSNGFKSATSLTQSGYIVEEAIPWTSIIPSNGTIIGFDLQVNDADENGNRIGIVTWCDPSGNSWQDTSGFGNLMLTSKSSGTLKKGVTFDDIKDSWAKDVIEVLASRHIIEGMTDTQYEPNKTVTRAEFTAMILRLLNIKEEPYSGEFSDVKSGDWYANAIEAAYKARIIEGDGKNMRPNDSITREEMTAIAMRAYEMLTQYKEESISATAFSDDKSISDWARNVVANAAKLGIVNGEPNNVFAPKGIATRAEAAAIIYGLLEKTNNL